MTDYEIPGLSAQQWPAETRDQRGIVEFYGQHSDSSALVTVEIPWKCSPQHIQFHRKCADSAKRIMNAYWEKINHDQSIITQHHLNVCDGTYNPRPNANDHSRWSMHSWGIAVDWAANWNANGSTWTGAPSQLPREFIDCWLAEGWAWGGDFSGTKDPMHFQATKNIHSDAPSEHPVVVPLPNPSPSQPLPDFIREIQDLVIKGSGVPKEIDAFKKSVLSDMTEIANKLTDLGHKVNDFQLSMLNAPVVTPVPLPAPEPSVWINKDITCTVFGGSRDPNKSAYDGHLLSDSEPGCSLPYRFSGKRPTVAITNKATGVTVVVPIVDVGPWYDGRSGWPVDTYWETHTRPRAETDSRTNHAAIDVLPATAKALGIDGKGKVDWHFVDQVQSKGGSKMGGPLTTTAGVGSILAAVGALFTGLSKGSLDPTALMTLVSALVSGVGLIFAKDHNVAGTH